MQQFFQSVKWWLPVLLSVSGQATSPQTVPPATLTAADASKNAIAFTWRQLSEGNASVWVTSTKDQTVHAQPARLTCSGGPPGTVVKLNVSPGVAPLLRNVPARFQLVAPAQKPVPGTCFGPVIFLDYAKNAAVQIVALSVAGPELIPLKLSVVLWRRFPLPYADLFENDFPVPAGKASDLSSVWRKETGSVSRATGGWTRVWWKGEDAADPVPRLVMDTPPAAGTYTGDLVLAEDPAKVTLSLTAIVKDIVIWPALTIILGVGLAFMVKRYAGVLRVTWGLRAQVADLDGEFRLAQAQFARDAAGQVFGNDSIADDFAKRRTIVLTALSAVEKKFASTLDSTNSDYQNAVITLQTLQTGVGLWRGLGAQLADLAAGLDRLEPRLNGADQEPPSVRGEKPAFVATARDLLKPGVIEVPALTGISQNAATLAALTKLWLTVRLRAAQLTAEFRSLRTQPGLPPQQVASLSNAIVSMWVHLLAVQDAAGLNALLISGADLDQCTIQLEQLRETAGLAGRALMLTSALTPVLASALTSVQAGEDPVDALVQAGNDAPVDTRRAEFLHTKIARADVASAIFSAVLALLTGLNLFYLGKAFGSIADYVSVFVWAAGTNVAIGLITAMIDRFTSSKPAA